MKLFIDGLLEERIELAVKPIALLTSYKYDELSPWKIWAKNIKKGAFEIQFNPVPINSCQKLCRKIKRTKDMKLFMDDLNLKKDLN